MEEDRTAVLVRQIESKVDIEGQNSSAKAQVAYGKLLTFATAGDKCKLYTGLIFAFLSGACLPLFFFFLGPVFDSFSINTTPDEAASKIREVCLIMLGLCIFIFITSFF